MNWITKRFIGIYQYKDLVYQLVSRDLKLKYRRSVLGYLWTILNPLLIMIVMTLVFSMMFNRNIPNYPVYLLIGRTVFDCVNESSRKCMTAITSNAALIKKTYVPKYVFVFSEATTCCVNFLLSLGALAIVMIATKVSLTWYILLMPLTIIQMFIFNLGFGLFLAQTNVFFRDITYIYNAFSTAWMYVTPIFYPIDMLPQWLQYVISVLNPMYFYIEQLRNIVMYGNIPTLALWGRGIAAALLALIIGGYTFRKNQHKFILYV